MFRHHAVGAIALSGVLFAASGCNPNPFCLNCSPRDGGADLAGGGGELGPAPDLFGLGEEDAGPDLGGTDGLVCNDPQRPDVCGTMCTNVQIDPNNCGMCFNQCLYPNAQGLCMAGKCVIGPCQPGY